MRNFSINNFDNLSHQYSYKVYHKKVAIFGITPPPLGGVSIHINRVTKKLKNQNNEVHNFKTEFRGRRFLLPLYLIKALLFLWIKKIDIIYYHSLYLPNSINEILFLTWAKKYLKYKIILVEHNCKHMYTRNKNEINKLNQSFKKIDQIIFMGKSNHKSYLKNNLLIPPNYTIESAFLPPNILDEKKIVTNYPKSLLQFINIHKPLLLANASRLYLQNKKDLYGLDKCIHSIAKLKETHQNIGLIFAIASIGDKRYFQKIKRQIIRLKITEQIYFLENQTELWPLMKKIDLFLRPTLRDGTSISLREALYFNVPVIASNVCPRPTKASTFNINSENEFLEKIKKNISSEYTNYKKQL